MIKTESHSHDKNTTTDNSVHNALEIKFSCNAGTYTTVRDYLHLLLSTLWQEGEDFSGKRPFGSSGWRYDLFALLISNGLISGSLDGDGYVQDVNKLEAEAYVKRLITVALYGVS